MKLEFLSLDKLCASKSNMRAQGKAPDLTDILPSIRARGVLVPILVRPAPDGRFEVIAGRRRHAAACAVAAEPSADTGQMPEPEPMPCAILDEGDDASALEASLIENIARLDPDEVTRWETFTALVRKGRCVKQLSATFGLPEPMIRRTLALGNLLPRIRTLYGKGEIDVTTVRHLTLATKSQQKAWLAMLEDADGFAPYGHQLKAWLFGGQAVPVGHALFDVDASGLAVVTDLFGEGGYFADSDAFWHMQNAAIAARRDAYLGAGWADVLILPPAEHFSSWEMEKTGKRKGGRVYIDVRASGEVCFHEGYLSRKEARRIARGETVTAGKRPPHPEVTSALRTYIDLHRHAAVRAELASQPQVALRLLVAHAIAGSPLWRVSVEPRRGANEAVAASAGGAQAERAFDDFRGPARERLGFPEDEAMLVGWHGRAIGVVPLFERLMALSDEEVLGILAVVMGETLACGSTAVDAVGLVLGTEMARWWQADDAFFDLLRDREVLGAIVAEVAGETVARANAGEKAKTMKAIIRAHLEGAGGRAKIDHWVPRWMRFAPDAYTARGSRPSREDALEALSHRSPQDVLADPDEGDEEDIDPHPLAA